MTSTYPLPVDELTDRVRDHAARIGDWPSRRQVMGEFKVGRPKAAAALDALRAAGFNPAPAGTAAATAPIPVPPGLHVVPAPAPDAADPTIDDHAAAGRPDDAEDEPAGLAEHGDHDGTDPTALSADVPAADTATVAEESAPVSGAVDAPRRFGSWPLVLIALGAFVSIWGGWVGLGELTGFGPIRLLPGIADHVVINSAITLPIGVEAYAAFALRAWLAPAGLSKVVRRFARWSAIGALALGAAGQIAYHLMIAAGITAAPWPITAFVSCLPVVVLGCGAALTHLIHRSGEES